MRSLIDRSASRRSTPVRSSRARLVPRIVTPCHCPPRTVIGRMTHSEKTVPTSLHPSSVTSKNFERRTSQATNAVDVWVDELNWQLWKVHWSKTAPEVVHSLKSTPVNVHSVKRAAPRRSPYQSSSRKSRPVASIGSGIDGAAAAPVGPSSRVRNWSSTR